ncbi:hypothetical protein A0H81_13359 [Grifola frondosa]|uniref:Uncharacterized protein n=1 Tax=Grifola frondosa TaxID=5627 RepID=A0A1C7LSB4_GRIFR|nr:hypothetical protein A0H81_13359 [Grifola frondosa]
MADTVWANYTKAVAFLENKVDSSGLLNVTGLRDWARLGQGGHNAEGKALYYRVLATGVDLASHINESSFAIRWAANASALNTRYEAFWLPSEVHFTLGNDERALDLLRREWGYMLYTNLSVQSTLLEGFTANGSL